MATTTCRSFQEQFEPGSNSPRDVSIHAHLRDCPACRSFVEDLGLIRAAAIELAGSDPEPSAQIWISLRAQLEQEGIIHGAAGKGWFADLFRGHWGALPRPVLAGAYLSVLLAVAFGLSGPINSRINRQRWLDGTQSSTTPLSAQLSSFENDSLTSRPDTDSPVTASLHSNLEIVDNYISLCQDSVREEPDNEIARDYLYEAYQQKADLVAQLNER